jgi:hypothetical protein
MKSRRARTAAATGKAAPLAKPQWARNAVGRPAFSLRNGTEVNTLFTITDGKRYAAVMLLAAVIAAVAASPNAPVEHHGPVAQAVAMVRVISGTNLRLDGTGNGSDVPAPRLTVYSVNGTELPAKLIEFQ